MFQVKAGRAGNGFQKPNKPKPAKPHETLKIMLLFYHLVNGFFISIEL
jgi:hypothetical protein